MNELKEDQLETLRFIHQSQREESLEHRKSIHSVFGLSVAGLAATLAGVIAAQDISMGKRWVILLAVGGLCASTLAFMSQQRRESEIAMGIVRRIERRLGLYDDGVYLQGQSVLPQTFAESTIDEFGFSPGDKLQVTCLLIFAVLTGVALFVK